MNIRTDGKGRPYIGWEQAGIPGGFKKAWIQRKTDPDEDWAGTGRYLDVVRSDGEGRGGGSPADFPVWSEPSDGRILIAFVVAVCGITGCTLPGEA